MIFSQTYTTCRGEKEGKKKDEKKEASEREEKDLWEFEQDFMFCAKFKYTFKINSFACVIGSEGAKICHLCK